jgi:hypothetical protein
LTGDGQLNKKSLKKLRGGLFSSKEIFSMKFVEQAFRFYQEKKQLYAEVAPRNILFFP